MRHADPLVIAGAELHVAAAARHRRLSEPAGDARRARGERRRDRDRIDPARQPAGLRGEPGRADRRPRAAAAQHGGLPDRARGGADRRARARSARDQLGEARGDRRPRAALSRRGRADRGDRGTGRQGLRGAALLQRRSGHLPQAGRSRRRRRDAARRADRLRARHSQPAPDRADLRARGRCRSCSTPGSARRPMRRSRWSSAVRPCCSIPRCRRRAIRCGWRPRCAPRVEAGRLARLAGRIPKRRDAEASSPQFGLVGT